VEATVRVVNPSAVGQREVELRLRSTITAHSNSGYEVLCNVNTNPNYGIQIVRWFGPLESFDYIGGTGALNCVNGDVLRATIAGNPPTITVWRNGVQVLQGTDRFANPPTTGSPGIGFWNNGATNADYGFSLFTALDGDTGGSGAPPSAPTGLMVALGTTASQLRLSWTDAATNEDGFKVERKTGVNGTYGQLATVVANSTGYVDAAVTAGTTYCYRVQAYNTTGDSAYSNEACATPASATLYTVSVAKSGSGSGTVASSPAVLDCGSTCSVSVAYGTTLALSATPVTGSTFTGWSGGGCSGTGSCILVVSGNTSVTATFSRIRWRHRTR
jgi:hypothetical protein